jgi:hypothetical protein
MGGGLPSARIGPDVEHPLEVEMSETAALGCDSLSSSRLTQPRGQAP